MNGPSSTTSSDASAPSDGGRDGRDRGGVHALGERSSLTAVVVVATICGATKPLDETPVGDVERGVLLVGSRLGPNDRTLAVAGDLDANCLVGQPRVRLLRQLHVDAVTLAVIPLDLRQLLCDVLAESI